MRLRVGYLKVFTIMGFLSLVGCAPVQISLEDDKLSTARTAIEQARAVKAEKCAPKLLAKAQSRLLWAAHELSENNNRSDKAEADALISQAESYAKQATALSVRDCKEEVTFILMPDEDGNVGSISVTAGGASRTIDKPFYSTSVRSNGSEPDPVRGMNEEQVKKQYSNILKAQPLKPAGFILYFISGTSELTEESKVQIPQVLKASKKRHPAEVIIIGHTDSTGPEDLNMKISTARAKAVEQLILGTSDSEPGLIYMRFHGENDQLIPTPDNTPEPRNRRVEIMVL